MKRHRVVRTRYVPLLYFLGGNTIMKKLVSSVLAASMVLSLAACGSSASTDTASSSEAASTSTAATAEAAGEGSGAYTGTPIKIGGIGPITGGAAVYGQAVKNAEELAVKEINAANGSDVFDWKFEDDEHDAEKSVNAYNTLKDSGAAGSGRPRHHHPVHCRCRRDRQ